MNRDSAKFSSLSTLARRYRAGDFTPPVYVARYVLQWQLLRHADHPAQRRSRCDPKPTAGEWLAGIDSIAPSSAAVFLADVFERYNLRGVRRRVNIALAAWLRGVWPLRLCERVPSSREVLRMQIEGTRPVTVIADYPRLLQPIEEKSDAFAFVCHDLEHAWQFFHDSERHDTQRRFAHELECAIDRGVFAPYMADPVFADKFDYLAADMNTHIAHSLQYLRAILLDFYLRAEGKAPNDRLAPESRERLHRCLSHFSASAAFIPEVAS
ncbi:MAG TPA: hypothetical protein VJS66_07985 [Burkholderiales bacterium]|nr:hypothetical protein [Burkholderiales bacterium]